MKPLEHEINHLTELYFEMHELIRSQLDMTQDAIFENKTDKADKVIMNERRVNFYENEIDKECEDFLALHQPVAGDLRLAIALIKISGNLERIGDHAYGLCRSISDEEMHFDEKIINQIKLKDLFDAIDLMLVNVQEAFKSRDVKLAKQVIKQDKILDKANKKIPDVIEKYLKKNKDVSVSNLVLVSRAIGKLERVGDLIKNISEETIFYIESTVIKHKKKNKKIKKRFSK